MFIPVSSVFEKGVGGESDENNEFSCQTAPKFFYILGTMNQQIDIENRRKKVMPVIFTSLLPNNQADPELQSLILQLEKCTPDEFDALFVFNKKRKTYTLSPAALQQRCDAARIPRKKKVASSDVSQDFHKSLLNLCDMVKEFESKFRGEINNLRKGE